jgi:outer membrane protein OmpA-like peptidoglycan-associated protein
LQQPARPPDAAAVLLITHHLDLTREGNSLEKSRMRTKACSALGALLLAACTTHADGTQSVNKTAVGAGVGALAGGVLGNRLDKDKRGRGTVIGAVAGAAAGGGIGYLMDRQEAELREQLASERTDHAIELERVRDDLLKLTMANEISFDFGSAAIKPTFKPTMYKLAEVLRKYDRNEITIIGHTDSTGSDSYNQVLSERRAVAVRDELTSLGVPPSRLRAIGRGEFEPRADNGNEAGRQLNRRVEIMVQTTS